MRRSGSNLAARLARLYPGAQRRDDRLLGGDALGDDPRDRPSARAPLARQVVPPVARGGGVAVRERPSLRGHDGPRGHSFVAAFLITAHDLGPRAPSLASRRRPPSAAAALAMKAPTNSDRAPTSAKVAPALRAVSALLWPVEPPRQHASAQRPRALSHLLASGRCALRRAFRVGAILGVHRARCGGGQQDP